MVGKELRSPKTITKLNFVVPSQKNLIELLKLASLGQMKKINQQINLLEKENPKYVYFRNKIRIPY